MLTIWGRPNSINVQKVTWMVAELGLENERLDFGGTFGGLDTPEFLALNPNGMIPVIRDGETVVWDSHAIIRYLAARYGSGTWWPEDPAMRSQGDRWMEWLSAQVWPQMAIVFWGLVRTPPDERNMDQINLALSVVNQFLSRFDAHLAGRDYILGDDISLADIPLGTFTYRYLEMDIDRPDLPDLGAYYERLKTREAYRTNVMLPIT